MRLGVSRGWQDFGVRWRSSRRITCGARDQFVVRVGETQRSRGEFFVTKLDLNLLRVLAATDAVLSCTLRCDQACLCDEVPVESLVAPIAPASPTTKFQNSQHVRKSGMQQRVSRGVHRRAFPAANCIVPGIAPVPRSERYFGASEAAIALNRGSPRKGSQSGCSCK